MEKQEIQELCNKFKTITLLEENDSDEDPDPIAYWDEDWPVYERDLYRRQLGSPGRLEIFLQSGKDPKYDK